MNELNYTENLLNKIKKLEVDLEIQKIMALNLNELRKEVDKKIRQAFVDIGGFGVDEKSEPIDVLIAHFFGQVIRIDELNNEIGELKKQLKDK